MAKATNFKYKNMHQNTSKIEERSKTKVHRMIYSDDAS
jgi:hypothetical protein